MVREFTEENEYEIELAKALGIEVSEASTMEYRHARLRMQRKAFGMREDQQTISQKEADTLNSVLNHVIDWLTSYHNYDAMEDYMVDFDSFVKSNKYYNTFSY